MRVLFTIEMDTTKGNEQIGAVEWARLCSD